MRHLALGALAGVALAVGCDRAPTVVAIRLRPVQSGYGPPPWYLVEVDRGRDRPDTIRGVRVTFPPAVIGDSLIVGVGVGYGGISNAFVYDVATRGVRRSTLPSWFREVAFDVALPAFSPDGSAIAYVARTPEGDIEGLVRSWPEGVVLARGPSVRQPILRRLGRMAWADSTRFTLEYDAPYPQTIVRLVVSGRVGDPNLNVDTLSWDHIFDSLAAVQRAEAEAAAQAAAAAEEARRIAAAALEARRDRVVDSIPRLRAAAFPDLPAAFARELDSLGCTVPQSYFKGVPHNVIRGNFGARGQEDWAALCSRGGRSVILVYWGGPARCPRELLPTSDRGYMMGLDDNGFGYSRLISTTDHYYDYGDLADESDTRRVPLEHDGIDDYYWEKASNVWFCRDGKWIELAGID